MKLNPDFRTIEQIVPPGHLSELTGWSEPGVSEREALNHEAAAFAALEQKQPAAFATRAGRVLPEMQAKWDEFQLSKGRYEGSADWSLFDEFVLGKELIWKPQIIGSCVMSNTFRGHVIRAMYQIVMCGDAAEYFGRNEFGTDNFAYYAAWSYGMARRRANMRRGDGLYCEPMAESLLKDGVVLCSTPKLIELTTALGVNRSQDYPEPQSKSVYRAFGSWQHLDELAPYACCPVVEMPRPKNADELWDLLGDCKTAFVCSSEAIKKVGEHPDGFPIHARDPRNSWSHNMAFHGRIVASDGERFFRQSNESWGGRHIYNRRFDEVADSFRRGRYALAAIGEIELPEAAPPPLPTN